MLRRIGRSTTFANVCSLLALTIAVGTGGAYAANTVFSTDIVDGEVKNADIAGNSITSNRIYPGSVTNTDIGADAVDGSKVFDASIGAADLGFESVNSGEIATDAVNGSEVAANAIDSDEILDNSLTLRPRPELGQRPRDRHRRGRQRRARRQRDHGRRRSPTRSIPAFEFDGGALERRHHAELRLRRQRALPRHRHLGPRRGGRRRDPLLGQHRPPRRDPALRRPRDRRRRHPGQGLQLHGRHLPAAQQHPGRDHHDHALNRDPDIRWPAPDRATPVRRMLAPRCGAHGRSPSSWRLRSRPPPPPRPRRRTTTSPTPRS